jgi:hypothetical protein
MEELSTSFVSFSRLIIPLIFILIGALLLILGSKESLRWRVNISSAQQLWMNIIGGALVVVGIGIIIIPIFITDRQDRASTEAPTELPPVFITITGPTGSIGCRGASITCSFEITGLGGGVAPPMDQYRIATFVFPLEPLGAGYYIQPRMGVMQEDGSWTQSLATIGDNSTPVENGHKLRIRAALLSPDASLDGTRLDQLSRDFYLGRVEDIQGIIALSEPVDLTVEK